MGLFPPTWIWEQELNRAKDSLRKENNLQKPVRNFQLFFSDLSWVKNCKGNTSWLSRKYQVLKIFTLNNQNNNEI